MSDQADDYNRRTVGQTFGLDGATRHGNNQSLQHFGEEARNQRPGAGLPSQGRPQDRPHLESVRPKCVAPYASDDDNQVEKADQQPQESTEVADGDRNVNDSYSSVQDDVPEMSSIGRTRANIADHKDDKLYKTCQNQHFSIFDSNYSNEDDEAPVDSLRGARGQTARSTQAATATEPTQQQAPRTHHDYASRESVDSPMNFGR